MDHLDRKGYVGLYYRLDHMDLLVIYRTFQPLPAEYMFFSSIYGTVSRIEHALGHSISLKRKRIKVISSIFF